MANPTLTTILASKRIPNENGEIVTDFEMRGRDCLDFCSVDRLTLQQLMEEAFETGRKQGAMEMMSAMESARR